MTRIKTAFRGLSYIHIAMLHVKPSLWQILNYGVRRAWWEATKGEEAAL
jgi:hypothetical protein